MEISLLRSSKPLVMGILNVTPDSFSDGGAYSSTPEAVERVRQMCEEGADIVDIGGESTRPGAEDVGPDQELERVLPIIEAVMADPTIDVPLSIDTSKPEVMRQAVRAGASMINDIRALREPGALELCAQLQVPVCLMHMLGQPRTMQLSPRYDNVLTAVAEFLQQRVSACLEAGISSKKMILDPGFGFGKTVEHNLTLLKYLDRICDLGYPVLVGVSRKSMFKQILGADVGDRLFASVAAAALAAAKGASILRVHDVKPTVDALKVVTAIDQAR